MGTVTVIDEQRVTEVAGGVHNGVLLIAPEALSAALGWSLEPEGLCRGDVCIPVRDQHALRKGDALDLQAVAGALHRPYVANPDAAIAALGAPVAERLAAVESGLAPDFELPDLNGTLHRLGDLRGRKVLLVAWASW